MTLRQCLSFDSAAGYPAGRRIRCERPSIPPRTDACRGENIAVDVGAGRLAVKGPGQTKADETA